MDTPAGPLEAPKTIGKGGRRVWLYPEWFRGRMLTWRSIVHGVLVAMLMVGPWIDIGAHPAIRVDIPGRRIHFWGLHLFATDGAYLMFLLGFIVLSVFLFTALFGRVWCGWACPQTVFVESLVRPIERLLEGNAHQRQKLDAAPWTAGKIARKLTKYAAYLVIAGGIGTTFTAYFLGRDGTFEAQLHPSSHPAGTFTFLFITGLLLFDFAYFREQVCLVVCPYGRFQSALLDRNSLTVVYDDPRGEPRGKKGTKDVGDCVDCRRCVTVCPTGTDIRRGVTMECTQCMACIDACDDVMAKLQRPKGLIRIASENAIAKQPQKIIRPRIILYGGALAAVMLAFAIGVAGRSDIEINVSRAVGAPYATGPDGRVQNTMQLRIANKGEGLRAFTVEAVAPADLEVVAPISPFEVGPGLVEHMPVFLLRDPATIRDRHETVTLRVKDGGEWSEEISTEFISGGPQ
ncbi:MAG: cytochrome c oxidase accessory protein CcoG [Deltaproteobacteria bacterium]|nr:cytochrome c oxidase accessory protein CcoG [Deltaproteobacteria bacterium]MBK8241441.1 cytochrome c oxidase accessory protein CcoG [Deltaproteobacteria bacterium]MBP7286323.1 cytochrome c oxidase accessory protein CcoG [Nannocystaceae bacterium]